MHKLKFSQHYKNIVYAIILLIYFVLMIYVQLHHEFWRDELQAWTIARDLSFIDIFKQMKYEGHPCIWHLILMPFSHLGFPPITMGFISIFFMLLAAILIMYKSPFHFIVKLLLLFSSPFLYFYSIQSRVYSLIPFLVCLLAMCYSNRMDKPWLFSLIIAILVNTHGIMIPFVGIIFVFFLKDIVMQKKYKENKYLISFGIILIGLVLFILQVNGSVKNNSIIYDIEQNQFIFSYDSIDNFLYKCLYGFIYEIDSFIGVMIFDNMSFVYGILIFLGVFLLLALIFSFKNTVLVLIPYLFIFYFHIFIWFSIPQRTTLLLIFMMYVVWINYNDIIENRKKIISFYRMEFILSVLCILTIPFGVKSLCKDLDKQISGALATSLYIEEKLPDAEFICPVDYVATSVTGYIDRDIFYNNIRKEYFTFVNWDQFWDRDISFPNFVSGINEFLKDKEDRNVYILYSEELFLSYDYHMTYLRNNGYIEKIYESPIGDKQESYVIYRITERYYNILLNKY